VGPGRARHEGRGDRAAHDDADPEARARPLKRDIIFLATSDEEIGAGVGAAWIVEHQADLVRDAEFLLNEGGVTRSDGLGGVEFYGVGTTEKSPFWLDVTAPARPATALARRPTNPVHRLIRHSTASPSGGPRSP